MSWAAHNPEKYDEIMAQGVANKFNVNLELAEAWLDSHMRERVLAESNKEICDAEADYFGGLVDAAKERMEQQ